MTAISLTGPGRISQFLWGPNQQSTLTFGYPTALDEAKFWRAPRLGSEQKLLADRAESWTAARDYWATFKIRWARIDLWSGRGGVQAFLDWGMSGQPFSFVTDAVFAPLFSLPGCLLVEPFANVQPSMEPDGSQQITVKFRNPTYDLGLAWR